MRPLLSRATLRVIINPFSAPLDENGRPCAIVHYDPEHTGKPGTVRRIGCSLEREVDEERERGKWRGRPPGGSAPAQYTRYDTKVVYDLAPQPVVDSVYHRRLVQGGMLIAADEETAKLCGVARKAPADLLTASAADRLQDWAYDHDGAPPHVSAWVADGHFKSWPGATGETCAQAAEAALKSASEVGAKHAGVALKARDERIARDAAPQNALRKAKAGERLLEVPASAYPPGATPLEPLSGEKEEPVAAAILEPGENVQVMDTTGGDA